GTASQGKRDRSGVGHCRATARLGYRATSTFLTVISAGEANFLPRGSPRPPVAMTLFPTCFSIPPSVAMTSFLVFSYMVPPRRQTFRSSLMRRLPEPSGCLSTKPVTVWSGAWPDTSRQGSAAPVSLAEADGAAVIEGACETVDAVEGARSASAFAVT